MIVKPRMSWLRMLFTIRGTSLGNSWPRILVATLIASSGNGDSTPLQPGEVHANARSFHHYRGSHLHFPWFSQQHGLQPFLGGPGLMGRTG